MIDCIVNLPAKLFLNTQIPAALWFMRRNRNTPSPFKGEGRGEGKQQAFADRSNEILFIDARNLGHLINRRTKELSHEDIKQITDTYHAWRNAPSPLAPLPKGEGNPPEPSPSGRGQGEGSSEGNKLPEKLLENARKLRKNQTDAEALLWSLLRNRQLNDCKFRRQHPVEPYILDFYCHEEKLAIELDGGQHNTESAIANDHKRTEYLKSQGITVLRFWNNDVLQNTESVLQQIYSALTPALSQRERESKAEPSPAGGRGQGEGNAYQDIAGFCASVSLERVKELDYVLTPGRYVGLPDDEDDFNFAERFSTLKAELEAQLVEEEKLNQAIAENLAKVSYVGM